MRDRGPAGATRRAAAACLRDQLIGQLEVEVGDFTRTAGPHLGVNLAVRGSDRHGRLEDSPTARRRDRHSRNEPAETPLSPTEARRRADAGRRRRRRAVGVRNLALTVLAVLAVDPGAAVRAVGLHPDRPRRPHQLCAGPLVDVAGSACGMPRAIGAAVVSAAARAAARPRRLHAQRRRRCDIVEQRARRGAAHARARAAAHRRRRATACVEKVQRRRAGNRQGRRAGGRDAGQPHGARSASVQKVRGRRARRSAPPTICGRAA